MLGEVASDPAALAGAAAALRARLAARRATLAARSGAGETAPVDPVMRERLRALGYAD